MKNKGNHKLLTSMLCMLLVLAMTLCTVGCGNKSTTQNTSAETPSQAVAESSSAAEAALTSFNFTVVDKEGNETSFLIQTDKETVGEALLEQGLIEGEERQYGLYVKTVNGITADYNEDGTYWAFYTDDEYATTGVDSTPVTEGGNFSFKEE